MAFATEHPVVAHSEYRAVDDVVRTGGHFEVVSEYDPAGDQPAAIEELERRIRAGERDIVLLGATGTGKSATTAWLIERLQRPDAGDGAQQDAGRAARQRVAGDVAAQRCRVLRLVLRLLPA